MRLVIFSRHDMEPVTIVDFDPSRHNSLTPGCVIRFLPRMKCPTWDEFNSPVQELTLKIVDVRMELIRAPWGQTWIGIADDNALGLLSTLLPGQIADWAVYESESS